MKSTWKNKTRKCDTKGFIHVASLNGVVGFTSSFLESLIVSTSKYDLTHTLMRNENTLPKLAHVP